MKIKNTAMSTEPNTNARTDGDFSTDGVMGSNDPDAEKPTRPDSKPKVDIASALDGESLNRFTDEMIDAILAIEDAANAERSVLTALTVHKAKAMKASDISDLIFYTPGSVYNTKNGILADYGLLAVEQDNPLKLRATEKGRKAVQILKSMYGVDMSVLLWDYYRDPSDQQHQFKSDSNDDDEIPADHFRCTLCDFHDESRMTVASHINETVDDDHNGRSSSEVDIIAEPPAKQDETPPTPAGGVTNLDQALSETDSDDVPDFDMGGEDTEPNRDNGTSISSPDPDASSDPSGGWQGLHQRPALEWDAAESEGMADPGEMLGNLSQSISTMSAKAEKRAEGNLRREEVRARQLKALAAAVNAYYRGLEFEKRYQERGG